MWLWNVDISDGGELGYGLIEGQFTLSHDEGNYVTAFTATEALKSLILWVYEERSRFFGVNWA